MKNSGTCASCGYDLRGTPGGRCPECGARLVPGAVLGRERPMGWRVHLFDLLGMGVIVIANVLLALADAVAVVGLVRASWFTDPVWNSPRGPQSINGLLLYALALSVGGWAAAWQRGSWGSWRWQVGLTLWCWVLTAVHVVGAVSLYL